MRDLIAEAKRAEMDGDLALAAELRRQEALLRPPVEEADPTPKPKRRRAKASEGGSEE
jgi:hypothetical protein